MGPDFAGAPAVSPDGKLIAWSEHRETGDPVADRQVLYVMNSDGSHVIQFTRLPSSVRDGDDHPAFSPNGGRIAFDRDGGAIEIMRVYFSGERAFEIVPASDGARRPRWSPDGRKLLFGVHPPGLDPSDHGSDTVEIVNDDGSGRTVLGHGIDPDWSPDGTLIVFRRFVPGSAYIALVVMRADGSNPIEIWHPQPKTDNFVLAPDWGTAP
jgi:Tol biopolymer transport system component